jgi:tRNA(fMet)-specific endonuclease VapC
VARLILDTGVLIAAVRGRLSPTAIPDPDDAAIAAVSIAEYLAGVHRDTDPGRQAAQRAFLADFLAIAPVEDYTADIAEHHAELLAHTRSSGLTRGAHDLIIAATARATDRTLLTTDARAGFGELPGVRAQLVG